VLNRLAAIAAAAMLMLAHSGEAAPPAPAAASDVPKLEDFAALPFIGDPVLSPDGKRIAARVISKGVQELAIYELPAGADSQPVLVPLGGLPVRWFRWAGSDRLLVGYSRIIFVTAPGMFAIAPATRLKRYELSSKSLIDIGASRGLMGDDVIFSDPWGRYILLSAQEDADDSPSVSRVDLKTGAAVEVQPKRRDIWNWFADAEGRVRGGISYSGKGYAVYYRTDPAGELRRTATGRMPADDSVVDSIRVLPGGDRGIIITNARTGRFGVYEYTLGNQEIGAALFEHPEVDVAAVEMSADGARIEGIQYEDDRQRVTWLVPELEALQAQIDRTFPGKVNRILNRSADSMVALVWSGSGDDPGSYYVFDRKARRMNLFASPYDPMVGKRLAPVRAVRYTSRDGLSIPAYLTLPTGKEARGLPLVVMPHGGPFLRSSYAYDPWAQFLASRGYAVLQPNFRGSTGYGRAFVERGHGQWGAAMQDDLDDGVGWLASEGIADPKRVCMMGASYGGYAALWASIRNPDKYRCAISYAGVTDVRAMLKYDTRMAAAPRYSKRWRQRVVGEEQRDLAAVSPLQQARRIAIPVLIAHGEADSNVPVDHARKLIAALVKARIAHEAVLYPGMGHGFEKPEDSIDFLKRVEAFLARHNPA
jgi:dipeptidyl aminopeptidase/acylaminoacyl peptidase